MIFSSNTSRVSSGRHGLLLINRPGLTPQVDASPEVIDSDTRRMPDERLLILTSSKDDTDVDAVIDFILDRGVF